MIFFVMSVMQMGMFVGNTKTAMANIMNNYLPALYVEVQDISSGKGRYGLLLGIIKKKHGDLLRVADAYFKEFASLVTTEQSKMDMFSDMDDFDNMFRAWAKIPADWKPKNMEK